MASDGVARFLVFRVGNERFAVELAAVHEVIEAPALQAVPDAPPTLLGVTRLRGEFVAIHDPRPVLRAGSGSIGGALLFARGARTVGLAIDDVDDAVLVEEQELRPAPGVDGADSMLLGLVRRGTDLIAVLDADALLTAICSETEGPRV